MELQTVLHTLSLEALRPFQEDNANNLSIIGIDLTEIK